jgi:predicted Zn-dependent protease with MMP-like domain/predicted Zn-dependent protease
MDFETLDEQQWQRVDHVHDLLDEGETEMARREVDALLRERPAHPDLLLAAAEVSLDEGDPAAALKTLQGAARAADPAVFFMVRALAHYDLCQFEPARNDAQQAVAIHADSALAHDLLSRIAMHLGEEEQAAEHAAAAELLDPEAFPAPLEVSDEEFDALVTQSIADLPERVRQLLDEIPVLVERLPDREMLTADDPPLSPDILGLFVGRHILERSVSEPPGTPNTIHLFRHNLLRECHTREDLAREIQITVQHEVGHLMSADEDQLGDWGLA